MRRHAYSDQTADGSDVPQQQPRTRHEAARQAREQARRGDPRHQRAQPGHPVEPEPDPRRPEPFSFWPDGSDGYPRWGIMGGDAEIVIDPEDSPAIRDPDPAVYPLDTAGLADWGSRVIRHDLNLLDAHNRSELMDGAPAARFDERVVRGELALPDAENLAEPVRGTAEVEDRFVGDFMAGEDDALAAIDALEGRFG